MIVMLAIYHESVLYCVNIVSKVLFYNKIYVMDNWLYNFIIRILLTQQNITNADEQQKFLC